MAKEGKDMDKKITSRNGSIATEAKGKEYNGRSSTNRHQRFHGKRREPWSAEANPQAKNLPLLPKSKNKTFDKRSRDKQNWTGRRDEVTKAQRAEFGSALPQGSKKINLNHLLNFKMEPRGYQQDGRMSHRGQWSTRNKWGSYRYVKYNKEQFLQANCQFVVKFSEDYTTNMHDADSLVDWDLVEQVRLLGHEVPSCPICLYPPSAAQITRCGHIFCWSCILHYLALSDKTWRKCPICYESIIKKDLKSVIATEQPLYKPGDVLTMCLMKRQRGSLIAQPVKLGENIEDITSPFNILESKQKTCFVKLLTASAEEVKHLILSSERAALEKQMQENDDGLESTFIQAALDLLKEREEGLSGGTPMLSEVKEAAAQATKSVSSISEEEEENVTISSTPSSEDYLVYASAFSDEEAEEAEASPPEVVDEDNDLASATEIKRPLDSDPVFFETKEPLNMDNKELASPLNTLLTDEGKKNQCPTTSESTDGEPVGLQTETVSKNTQVQKTHTYYFYQSDDGQPIFIHPLNVRCLVQQYGSLDQCLLTITAKIVEIEHMSMSEDIRHRLRYMKHLPLTCNFAVCELNLKPPIVSEETLHLFHDDFLKRKKARDRKLKEEKRRERRMQAESDRIHGISPKVRFSLQSNRHFPSFESSSVSDDQLTFSSGSGTSSPGMATPVSTSVEKELMFPPQQEPVSQGTQPAVTVQPSQPSVPSFAQMLREGQAKPTPPRKIPSQSPSGAQSAVGQAKVGNGSDESENEDYVPVPQYQHAFSDAIQDALDKMTLSHAASKEGQTDPINPGGRKGKKGRKKQQVLFSTAGPRFK